MALELLEVAARFVGGAALEVAIVSLFYWPGWLLLRMLTLGHYPPRRPAPHNRAFVAVTGFAAIMVALLSTVPGGWM